MNIVERIVCLSKASNIIKIAISNKCSIKNNESLSQIVAYQVALRVILNGYNA